jgi:hypothetical protein
VSLALALEAILAGDLARATAALVDAWRERRLPAIADLVTVVEKRRGPLVPPPPIERALTLWAEVERLPEENRRRRDRLAALVELPDVGSGNSDEFVPEILTT